MTDARDIVERLRGLKWKVHCEMRGLVDDETAYEAADTIASLRKQLEDARSEALEEAAKKLEREWPGPAVGIIRALKGKS